MLARSCDAAPTLRIYGGVPSIERASIARGGTMSAFMNAGTSTQLAAGTAVPLGHWRYLPGGDTGSAATTQIVRAEVR